MNEAYNEVKTMDGRTIKEGANERYRLMNEMELWENRQNYPPYVQALPGP